MGSLSGITDSSFSVIYDTNTFISAYGWGGKPEKAVKIGFYDTVSVYVSAPILKEYQRVLSYDRLQFTPEEQDSLVNEFRKLTNAEIQEVAVTLTEVEDDPDDDKFLELAVEIGADYIVSGDKHLKRIEYFEYTSESHDGTHVISSDEFLNMIEVIPPKSSLRDGD